VIGHPSFILKRIGVLHVGTLYFFWEKWSLRFAGAAALPAVGAAFAGVWSRLNEGHPAARP